MFGSDRSKRIARIAASAAPHLEEDERVRELVQVQSGRSAQANSTAVRRAFKYGEIGPAAQGAVQSFAVLATDRNLYLLALTGIRLLDVGDVVLKTPLSEARASVEDKVITLNEVPLHVMDHYQSHVAGLRDLLATAKAAA